MTLLTGIALISGWFCLPETKGKPLPDTLDDVKGVGPNPRWRMEIKRSPCCGEEESLLVEEDELANELENGPTFILSDEEMSDRL